ncbi:MAG: bifunctional nuclease family protein, partial [Acidimicrobiales bacterium]
SFPIGQPEGVALAMAWHQLDTPRPLTHELMIDALSRFGVSLAAVLIDGLEGRTYLAQLVLDRQGDMVTVACRPSDALTLAMRHPVPVPLMVEEALLPPAPVEEPSVEEPSVEEPSVEEPSVEELDSASPAATAAGGDGPGDDWVETQLAVEQAAAAAEARDGEAGGEGPDLWPLPPWAVEGAAPEADPPPAGGPPA